ncbi:MAG: hypothetical protein WAW71_12935 [Propioniciclava sp.]
MSARGVFQYRDAKARDEIDAVGEASDGRWVVVEVKLGLSQVDAAAATLVRVVAKVCGSSTRYAPGTAKWVGAIVAMLLVLWLLGGSAKSISSDPCFEAQTARDIAARSTGDKRTTALLEAFDQQAKCDAQR